MKTCEHGNDYNGCDRCNTQFVSSAVSATEGWEPLMRRIEKGLGKDADSCGAFDELWQRLQRAPQSTVAASEPRDVKRYSPDIFNDSGDPKAAVPIMTEDQLGGYVSHSDYRQLERECDAAVDEFREARNTSYLERAEKAEAELAALRSPSSCSFR